MRVFGVDDLPALVLRSRDQISERGGLHLATLLQRVEIHLELHPCVARA